MKVLFLISHPARVHLFKNVISELQNDNHEAKILVRDREVLCSLLDACDLDYSAISNEHDSLPELIYQQLQFEVSTLKSIATFQPDLVIGGIGAPVFAKFLGTKSVKFFDTDHVTKRKKIQMLFLDQVYSPDCYQLDHGQKHIRYPSYHELAYLHPNRFEPDPNVLDEAGLTTDDTFVILRTVDWQALHDIGDSGFDDIVDVVTQLEATGAKVLITAEGDLPAAVSRCQLDIEPHRIHDLMAYADLFIGESATMASESAVLGTPAVYISSIRLGYLNELEEKYGLVFNFSEGNRHEAGLEKAVELLKDSNSQQWAQRRERLLEDKIDTTEFILEQITSLTKDND